MWGIFDEPLSPEADWLLKESVKNYLDSRRPRIGFEAFATWVNSEESTGEILGDDAVSRRSLEGWIKGEKRRDGSRHYTQPPLNKLHAIAKFLVCHAALDLSNLIYDESGLGLAKAMQNYLGGEGSDLANWAGIYGRDESSDLAVLSLRITSLYRRSSDVMHLTFEFRLGRRAPPLSQSSRTNRGNGAARTEQWKGWGTSAAGGTMQAYLARTGYDEDNRSIFLFRHYMLDNEKKLALEYTNEPFFLERLNKTPVLTTLIFLTDASNMEYVLGREETSYAKIVMNILRMEEKENNNVPNKLNKDFLDAARALDFDKVIELLEAGADVNVVESETGRTALADAALHSTEDMVEMLLEWPGIDPTIIDVTGRNASNLAFLIGNSYLGCVISDAIEDWRDAHGQAPLPSPEP